MSHGVQSKAKSFHCFLAFISVMLSYVKVYSSRWIVLSVFCILEMSNALLWVTFAPISDIAQIYFGGKESYYGSTTSINMFVNIERCLFSSLHYNYFVYIYLTQG